MKKFLKEFKEFALRGNVMDLAVGVIIGAAFQGIVNSLVNDIISPIIGIAPGVDMTQLAFTINGSVIRYGAFIMAVVNFVIMALVIFLIVKLLNKLSSLGAKKEEAAPAPTTQNCPFCQTEIPVQATRCPHCTSMLEK